MKISYLYLVLTGAFFYFIGLKASLFVIGGMVVIAIIVVVGLALFLSIVEPLTPEEKKQYENLIQKQNEKETSR